MGKRETTHKQLDEIAQRNFSSRRSPSLCFREAMAGYDRESELKAFDEAKTGVKGLVDAGVTQIPLFFHQPPDAADCYEPTSYVRPEIPVIDLGIVHGDTSGREAVVELVRQATETFGFFQVVNHGIPRDVLDRMLEGVRKFNNLELEEKMRYYTRDSSRNVRFNTNFDLFQSRAANWRDSLFCMLKPEPAAKPEELPDAIRDIILEYTGFMQKLGNILFELLSEALGLKTHYLKELGCSKGLIHLSHYYPPCPEPQLTIGISKHSDPDFLTVLLQDHIGGLQVYYQNQWIEAPPIPGALLVNIGDLLQLITNDKFKSIEHRVMANKTWPRVSIASFFTTREKEIFPELSFGPIKKLLTEKNPPKYKDFTVREYTVHYNSMGLKGKSAMEHFRL